MNLKLEVNNKTKSPTNKLNLKRIAKRTIENSRWDFLSGKNIEISLAFVSKEEMRKINKNFRKKNEATDVLSFAEFSSKTDLKKAKEKDIFLGELILCYNYIKEYAQEKKLDLNEEITRVFSHGVLHLLGFQHGKKMFSIQDKIITNCEIDKNRPA